MNKFHRATPITNPRIIEAALADKNVAKALRAQIYKFESGESELWINEMYAVEVDRKPLVSKDFYDMIHLSIKRIDRAPIHDWRDLQEIKNELVGEMNEAVELYPAEDRVVDTSNQYHLWVFVDPEIRFPFGWTSGMRGTPEQATILGAVQRPMEDRKERQKARRKLVR